MRGTRAWATAAAALVVSLAFAGCFGGDGSGGGAATEAPTGAGDVTLVEPGALAFNYTTPHGGGERAVIRLSGTLQHDGFYDLMTPMGGTCCNTLFLDASEAWGEGNLVAVRLTLNWTNEPTSQADLDLAACYPEFCVRMWDGGSQGGLGAQSVTGTFTTGDYAWWDGPLWVGARPTNGVFGAGLPFEITVDATPIADGLGVGQAYRVDVPENATLHAWFASPLDGEVAAMLVLYGPDDRPVQILEVDGADGTSVPLSVPPGDQVLYVADSAGGFVRLSTDRAPSNPAVELRTPVGENVVLGVIGDATTSVPATAVDVPVPPGTAGLWAWFEYPDAPTAIQPNHAYESTVTSSSGTLMTTTGESLSWRSMFGCVSCRTNSEYAAANILDDDGTYAATYASQGAEGRAMVTVWGYEPR